jgi:hypothetical protein
VEKKQDRTGASPCPGSYPNVPSFYFSNIPGIFMSLRLFDCNASIGRKIVPHPWEFSTLDRLIAEWDHLGISEGLVYHSLAKEYSPAVGNSRLMDEISGHNRLHPCWVLMPAYTDELERPHLLIPKMIARGVRAARIFPSPPVPLPEFTQQLHRFPLIPAVCDELLGALEQHKVPLFLEVMDFSSVLLVGWDSVQWILSQFPGLPLILSGVRHRDNRTLYALLDHFENVLIDISLYTVHRGIEDIISHFGPQKMLFGTGLPVYGGGGSLAQLTYAEIEESHKQWIAADNLLRLLQGVRSAP